MLTLHRSFATTAALALLLGGSAVALPVFAADEPTPQAQPDNPPAPDAKPPKPQMDPADKMKHHTEVRIKTLHDAIGVTKDQDAAWENVAQTMRDSNDSVSNLVKERHSNTQNMTAIDNIKSYQGIAQAHADSMAKFVAAFEPFYNTLTDTQKKKADAFFSKMHDEHHMHDHHGAPPKPSAKGK